MRVEFADLHLNNGWAEDDGTTYTWEYAGSDADISALLLDAETWTMRATGLGGVTDDEHPRDVVEETTQPIEADVRIIDVANFLERMTPHVDIIR